MYDGDGGFDSDEGGYDGDDGNGFGPCDLDMDDDDRSDGWDDDDDISFADPGGRSALRAATRSNPRNLPCPTCGAKNVLTPADRQRGYCCDRCADRAEGRGFGRSDY